MIYYIISIITAADEEDGVDAWDCLSGVNHHQINALIPQIAAQYRHMIGART